MLRTPSKFRIARWLTAIAITVLAACRPQADLRRVYRIGTDNTYPYHFLDTDGKVHGMVGEVVQEAARRSGVRLDWQVMKEGPHAALSVGKVDLWPLLSVQKELWPRYHFTAPYLSNA